MSISVVFLSSEDRFSRTRRLLGREAMEKLAHARVAVFGIGGVGGYVCEALVRSGIGAFDLIDRDVVSLSNLNRQIIALETTVGRPKTEVMRERMLQINPAVRVELHDCFFLPETSGQFSFNTYDYVVDAVDTVTAKLEIIRCAREANVPVISSMGAGNKMDASALRVADIYDTKVCPLAKVMRRELKKRGIDALKVVYSEEKPLTPLKEMPAYEADEMIKADEKTGAESAGEKCRDSVRKAVPGSMAFVPAAAGLIIAGEVVRDLVSW